MNKMYKVAIRKNETGEIRLCEQNLEWDEHSDSWWTEGNMSCDCNRFLEFERAGGKNPEWDSAKCSKGKYSALYAELPDGTKIKLVHEMKS